MKHQFLNNDVHKKLAKQLTVKISSHNLQLGFALFLCRGHEKVNPSVPIKAVLKPIIHQLEKQYSHAWKFLEQANHSI